MRRKEPNDAQVVFRLPRWHKERLDLLAAVDRRSVGNVMRDLVERWLTSRIERERRRACGDSSP